MVTCTHLYISHKANGIVVVGVVVVVIVCVCVVFNNTTTDNQTKRVIILLNTWINYYWVKCIQRDVGINSLILTEVKVVEMYRVLYKLENSSEKLALNVKCTRMNTMLNNLMSISITFDKFEIAY